MKVILKFNKVLRVASIRFFFSELEIKKHVTHGKYEIGIFLILLYYYQRQ